MWIKMFRTFYGLLNLSVLQNIILRHLVVSFSEILASYNDHNVFLFDDINTGSELQASVAVHEYEGHRNNMTVKSVNFFGPRSEFVVSGSDCGKVFFWDKESQKVVHFLEADGIGAVSSIFAYWTTVYTLNLTYFSDLISRF